MVYSYFKNYFKMNSKIQCEKNNCKIIGSSYFVRIIPKQTWPDQWESYPFAIFYDVNATPLLIVPLVPCEYKVNINYGGEGEKKREVFFDFPKSTRLEKILDTPNPDPNPNNTVYKDEYFYDVRDTLVLIGAVKTSYRGAIEQYTNDNNNVCYYTLHQQTGAPISWTETPYVCFRDNSENEIYRVLLHVSEYNSTKQRFDNLLSNDRKKIVPTNVSFVSCPKTGATHVGFYDSQKRLITSKIFLNTEHCNTKTGTLEELRAALINSNTNGIEYDVNITSFTDGRTIDYNYPGIGQTIGKCLIL